LTQIFDFARAADLRCRRRRRRRSAATVAGIAALSLKADDPVDAALQGAFLAAISLKFDHQLSSKPKLRA
jgi:hypothetical protein